MATPVAKGDKPQQIQVFVRTRPISRMERDCRSITCVEILGPKEIGIKQPHGKKYSFDRVFGPNSKQVDIYLTVVYPMISEVLAGYNCTIFAYGQTGAGKTYTMVGGSEFSNNSWQEDELAGIIPRTLAHLFDELRVLQQENTVRVSYLELYNEELYDLLADTDENGRIRIFEDQHQKGSVIIQGIEEQTVLNKNEVYKILDKGQEKRRTAATLMNAQSSRSHTVFTITVHTRETTVEGEIIVKTGKLHLVDLAGSENIGKSGAVDKRAREAGSINQSLLTLGRVIKALVERGQHIPYRESKLTRILQDSLGGRTKTSIIANISLASSNVEETLSTLEYANRARNITNRPEVNLRTSQKGLIMEYLNEINRLRKDLSAARTGTGVYLAQENYDKLVLDNEIKKEELSEKIVLLREIQEKIKNLEEQKAYVEEQWQVLQASFEKSLANLTKELEKTVVEKEEEQHLAKCYEEKALKLHSQAHQLLNVTKSSLNNEDHLHKKITSLRELANKNVTSVRSVIKNVANVEHTLADKLIQHMIYSSRTNRNLMQLVKSSREQIPETRQQNAEFRKMFLEQINVSATGIFKDLSENQRRNLESCINDVYDKCTATLEEQRSICDGPIDSLCRSLAGLLNDSLKRYEDFCISLSEQVMGISSLLETCYQSTETNTQKIRNALSMEFSKLDTYLEEQQKCSNHCLTRVENNQKSVQELLSLSSKLQSIIQDLESNSTKHKDDIVQETVLNQHCVASLTEAKNILQTDLPPIIATVKHSVDEVSQLQGGINEKIDIERKQVLSDNTKQELIQTIQAHTKSIPSKTEALINTVNQLSNNIKIKQTQDHENCKLVLESHIQKVEGMMTEQSNKHEEALVKSLDSFNKMEAELAELENSTHKNKELIECSLHSTQQELMQLINNKTLEMEKSGDTPVRLQIPSSIKLLQPSPRQRLLMRYKEQNMLKSEVLNEETVENADQQKVSTPSPLHDVNDPHRYNRPTTDLQKEKGSLNGKKSEKENVSRE